MRIRSTKPEFWRSKRIASVPWEARLVLKALESYVDDNGVGEDDVNVIVGDCFLHDLIREPSRTLARVSEAISALETAGLVWRYEADGKKLLFIAFWEDVQRVDKPLAGRKPRPDGTLHYKESRIREASRVLANGAGALAPGTGEQGNRGTGDQGTEEQTLSSEVAVATSRPEIDHLLDLLDSEIERNGGKKPSRTKKNIDAARLLLDRDGRTVEQVENAIRWAQGDDFWRSNILSMSKLREKYDTLRLRAMSNRRSSAPTRGDEHVEYIRSLADAEPGDEEQGEVTA